MNNRNYYTIGQNLKSNDTYIFTTLLAYALDLNKFSDVLALNNINGPFNFTYNSIFCNLVQTDTFNDLKNPHFSPERTYVNLKCSDDYTLINSPIFNPSENLDLQEDPINLKSFVIRIHFNALKSKIINGFNKRCHTPIKIAKVDICLREYWPEEYKYDSNQNRILLKIEKEFELQFSPLLYCQNEKDVIEDGSKYKPRIGMSVILQKLDPYLIPIDILEFSKFGYQQSSNDDTNGSFKKKYIDNEVIIKLLSEKIGRKNKRHKYKEFMRSLAKNQIDDADGSSVPDINQCLRFDRRDIKCKCLDSLDNKSELKIQSLEYKILELEKELNAKTMENINLSQKLARSQTQLHVKEQEFESTKLDMYKRFLITLFQDLKLDTNQKILLNKRVSNFLRINLYGNTSEDNDEEKPIKDEAVFDDLNADFSSLIRLGIFDPNDTFIKYIKSVNNELDS
ncbi:unnamed protein product [Gordionus sp. m RMFG-2023]|uniref:uncharacterized protein LOC135928481 n=1 Tax=Gordionus sp. m RMFG-2023 TaxID=3053472 RepID=UPI0030E401F3